MALHRLALAVVIVTALLGGCGNEAPQGQSGPRAVVEALPATKAIADVDGRATLALKQEMITRFPQTSDNAVIEAALLTDGFECSPNPTAPSERACVKANREGACEINTIIRTLPYAPEKSQIIKICETNVSLPAKN